MIVIDKNGDRLKSNNPMLLKIWKDSDLPEASTNKRTKKQTETATKNE